ncbi:MAG: glycoside hydrolase family 18 protein [bacterium]
MSKLNLSKTVIGYYPEWINPGLPPEQLDFSSLTHVALAFLRVNEDGSCYETPAFTAVRDELVKAAHAKNVRVLVSFGGGSRAALEEFQKMTVSSVQIKSFAKWSAAYAKKYGFDGLDMDWEFPNNEKESKAYTEIMVETKKALLEIGNNFYNEPYYLSLAMPQGKREGDFFDVAGIEPCVDTFNIMTYDYYSDRTGVCGHNAPLYKSVGAPLETCLDVTMDYWINLRNMPKHKALIGIPFYGRGWSDCAEINDVHTVNYKEDEKLYAVIEQNFKIGWEDRWDSVARVPYRVNTKGKGVIGFDNEQSISEKCEYAIKKGFAGTIIWAVGQDAIKGQQPLLRKVGEKFR